MLLARRLPVGMERTDDARMHYRVWAPARQTIDLVIESKEQIAIRLTPEGDGYHSAFIDDLEVGALYRLRLDGGDKLYPDPITRFQPQGVHGPSQVVEPYAYQWSDDAWPGITPAGQVLYEMHIGTFTPEGTWQAAERELQSLKDTGITCLEIMPVAEFAGNFGWGYDGVDLFAPTRLYGTPDDFRRFVDRAHAIGLGVILDVVYNHLGPDGNYLTEYSPDYFSESHKNDWGRSLNFDGQNAGPVREYFISNARYWIEEFHLDGFRFDATQAIVDDSPLHVLAEICKAARTAAGKRKIFLVNENEPQHTRLVRSVDEGGYCLDALWNDDFHHSAMVALTGKSEAYYTDHLGAPQEFISAAKWGYLYQGQYYSWQKQARGTPALDLPPTAFVNFIQNHDQIANSGQGLRAQFLTSPGQYRAMTALLLLMPQTPMLFQGQEFAASNTFHYFADHTGDLAKMVREGRGRELSQFPSIATAEMQAALLNPADVETFNRSKLDLGERQKPGHREILQLHKDLLRLRRDEPVFRRVSRRGDIDGAVLGPDAFVLRYFGEHRGDTEDLLVIVNLGIELRLTRVPEPLLAPSIGKFWEVQWTSDLPKYGGPGTAPVEVAHTGWAIPGRCTVILRATAIKPKTAPADSTEKP